jgi:Spy/CpxP family protein refolding chaperone
MRLCAVVGLALLSGAGLSGCQAHSTASAAPDPDGESADGPVASELREHHRHHHRGGLTQFIAMSLDTLGTDEARRPQVERLQDELSTCLAPTRGLERTLLLALADDVAAGTRAPGARLDEAIGRLQAAGAAMPDCSAPVLDRLHALLTPGERAALVEKVEAHLDVWREVNDEGEARGPDQATRMTELTRELGLGPAQVEQLSAALDTARTGSANRFDARSSRADLEGFAAAFVAESFDARAAVTDRTGRLMTHGARRMTVFYETVAPLLTPAQRATLAGHLREHANHQPAVSAK